MVFEEYGLAEEVLSIVSEVIGCPSSEIQVILILLVWRCMFSVKRFMYNEKLIIYRLKKFVSIKICRRGIKLSRKVTKILGIMEKVNLTLRHF